MYSLWRLLLYFSSPNQAGEKKQNNGQFVSLKLSVPQLQLQTNQLTSPPTFFPRIARLVMAVRGWAKKGRKEEERPDSFLERFRGPDVKALASESATAGGDGLAGQGRKK